MARNTYIPLPVPPAPLESRFQNHQTPPVDAQRFRLTGPFTAALRTAVKGPLRIACYAYFS